jgi:hypothetical protein
MSRKHQPDDTADYPTHPTKPRDEVNGGQVSQANHDQAGIQSRDDKLVEIGRGIQTAGRQNRPQG